MLNRSIVLSLTAIFFGLLALLFLTAAHADAGVLVDDPGGTLSRVAELWRGGQIIQAVIVGAFVGFAMTAKHISWLSQGKRAVYVAAALAGLGILAEAAVRGTTPTLGLVMTAVLQVLGQLMNSNAPAQVAAGAKLGPALSAPGIVPPPTDGAA